MNCRYCGTENSESATFCNHCGNMLKGKNTCPYCGTPNEPNSRFCELCGRSLTVKAAQRKAVGVASNRQKGTSLAGSIVGMCGVLFSLIFVFFIGVKTVASVLGIISVPTDDVERTLFYYFGDAYNDVAGALSQIMKEPNLAYEFACYYPLVVQTVLSAVTLVSVVTFATLATVYFLKRITGNSQKSESRFILATVLSYLAGVLAFYSIECYSLSIFMSHKEAVTFNGATYTGFVFVILLTLAFVIIKAVEQYFRAQEEGRTVSYFVRLGALAFGCIVLFLASGCITTISFYSGNSENVPHLNGSYGCIDRFLLERVSGKIGKESDAELLVVYFPLIGRIIQIAFLALTASMIGTLITGQGKKKRELVIPILLIVFAVLHLTFSVLSVQTMLAVYGDSQTHYVVKYAQPITSLVLAAITASAAITGIGLHKQQEPVGELHSQTEENIE